jgi:4,5:9,10-diseco-3-hydroxy-5,9,17-trioxoandrosta-1(10),2-diene-4-oate hydrolase
MNTATKTAPKDRYVAVDNLQIRYIEEGEGPAVVLLHGASLGSSADVFLRNMGPLAKAGFRVIAMDQPGFGLSDTPADHSPVYRRKSIAKFIEALGLSKVALIAHSQAGAAAALLALQDPARYSHLVILGTAGLLPPLDEKAGADGQEGAVQQRLERRMAAAEPTIEDTRKLLEANLFHHELITPEELALRHERSIGKPFEAFVARSEEAETPNPQPKAPAGTPLWKRIDEFKMPLLMIYGKNDRANAFERATLLKKQRPNLQLHIADGCKHLVPWDAADMFHQLTVPFLKG